MGWSFIPSRSIRPYSEKILEMERVDRYKAPLILEGGAIHVDGEGIVLVTDECLLEWNSNPELGKEEYEQYLKDCIDLVNHMDSIKTYG